MNDSLWNDVRRVADELELKLHLGTMDARDRWREIKPRLAEMEKTLAESGEQLGDALVKELTAMGHALRKMLDDIKSRLN